jgi:6-phosphofructokinase 1
MVNKPLKRIGVLTSGGDSPGMNPCIRAVVRTGVANGLEVYGIEDGYEGLIRGSYRSMGPRDVSGILQRGGTILRTARCEEMRTEEGQKEAIRQLNRNNIDALVVVGGDGSLNGAMALHRHGFPVIGLPASIDNDIYGSDLCIGVDTALNTIVEAIDKLRDTASSHSRAFLIETMGRSSGYLALMASIITGAEMVLLPEIPTTVDDVIKTVEEAYIKGKQHCIIVVAEGFSPRTTDLARMIGEKRTGFSIRVTILGHIQRGGTPSAYDRWLSSRFGVKAIEFLLQGQSGVMVGLSGREMRCIPIEEVTSQMHELSKEYYDIGRMLAK